MKTLTIKEWKEAESIGLLYNVQDPEMTNFYFWFLDGERVTREDGVVGRLDVNNMIASLKE